MQKLVNYLSFDGTCEEAITFYAKVLNGTIRNMMRNSDAPGGCESLPAGNEKRIMNAMLDFDGGALMAGDSLIGMHQYEGMKGFFLTLTFPDVAEGKRVFDALSEGGRVTMPLQKTFWAESFGMLTDRFGTPWAVNGGPLMG